VARCRPLSVSTTKGTGFQSVKLAQPGHPVGPLAGQALEAGVDRAQRVGIEAHPRHQQEIPLARPAHRHAPDRAGDDDARHEVEGAGQLQLASQHVRSPPGPHRQGGGRADQGLDGLVDGAVAAVDDHEVDAGGQRLRGEPRGVGGAGGGPGHHRDALRAQGVDHPGDGVKPIALLAGTGVVDEDRGARQRPR